MEFENYNYLRSRVRDAQVINTSFSNSFFFKRFQVGLTPLGRRVSYFDQSLGALITPGFKSKPCGFSSLELLSRTSV